MFAPQNLMKLIEFIPDLPAKVGVEIIIHKRLVILYHA
jgi:hypothetical protein